MNNEENSGKEFDKAAFLKEERDKALVKLASFNQNYQNPYPSPFLNLSDIIIRHPDQVSTLENLLGHGR
mgnify:CR=1 FL=1